MEIYLVRHTFPDIEQGICYGQTDIALPAEFERHAGEVIAKIPDQADAVFSSPLSRCARLAALFPHSIPYRTDPRLLEMNFGNWEMKRWNDISPQEPWFADYIHTPVPGGESYRQLYNRVSDFLDSVRQSDFRKVIVVTHAGVIKSAISHIKQIPLDEVMKISIQFGSVHRFEFNQI